MYVIGFLVTVCFIHLLLFSFRVIQWDRVAWAWPTYTEGVSQW